MDTTTPTVDIEPAPTEAYADRSLPPRMTEVIRLLTSLAGVEEGEGPSNVGHPSTGNNRFL